MNVLITIGPAVLLLALVLAIAYAVLGRIPRNDEGQSRVGRYVLGVGVAGVLAYLAGTAFGIAAFCAPENAGNLCGLGGIFGSGPLLAGVAIAIYAHRQTKVAMSGRGDR